MSLSNTPTKPGFYWAENDQEQFVVEFTGSFFYLTDNNHKYTEQELIDDIGVERWLGPCISPQGIDTIKRVLLAASIPELMIKHLFKEIENG